MSNNNKNNLEDVLHIPAMYGFEADLGKAISFVAGFNAANNNILLKDFREWYLVQIGESNIPFA